MSQKYKERLTHFWGRGKGGWLSIALAGELEWAKMHPTFDHISLPLLAIASLSHQDCKLLCRMGKERELGGVWWGGGGGEEGEAQNKVWN